MLEEDYLMKMIHQIVWGLMRLLFQVQEDRSVIIDPLVNEKYHRLLRLLDKGKINEAENQLFDQLDTSNLYDLQMALLFYDHLTYFSAEELTRAGFSQREIREGLSDVLDRFGYQGLDAFLSIEA